MSTFPFHRMVIRFRQGGGPTDRPVRLVAQLASAWRVELVGAFAPDPNLGRIAGHPAMREFRLHQRKWSSLERATITSELHSMSRQFERSFVHVLRSANVHGRFAEDVGLAEGDLLVVCEPDDPLEQLCRSFRDEILMALRSGRAVLVVPRQVRRSRGPVVVLSRASDDPVRSLGAEIAARLGESMLTVEQPQAGAFASLPARLEAMAPRLVVVPREDRDELAGELSLIASTCRIPLLVGGTAVDDSGLDEA